MKKLVNKTTAYLLCATALLSCVKEVEPSLDNSDESIVPEGYVLQTFSAVSEQTKTSIVSGNTVWNEEDKILTLCTDGTVTDPFSLVEGAGTTAGKFQGLVPDGKTVSCAIYPHDVYTSASETTVSVSIASEQPGTFAAGNIAVAKVDNENKLSFKNVNSFLVFQLKPESGVTKVKVSSVDGSPLAGIVAVDCSGETPTAGEVSEASPSVSMTTDGEGIYYMSIVSGVTHAQGLKMTYYSGEEETGVYYFNRNLKIAVNMMYQLGEVETDGNYYVTVDGAGSRNGMNWANAFSKADMWKRITLSENHTDATNEAKFAALDGATFHMAAGEYDWGAEATISIEEDEEIFFKVIGGYNASTAERDLENNVTVFTGKSEHQIFVLGGNMDVEFDGVNFANGYADGNGGALQISSGSWTFRNCKFSDNEAAKNGGAISISGGSLSLRDSDFTNNVALNDNVDRTSGNGYGGALDSDGAALSIRGGTFSGNVAWRGGALSIYNCGSDLIISDVTFCDNGNVNTRDAGAVYAAYPTNFHNCKFTGNKSKFGAGAYVRYDKVDNLTHFYGCYFEGNEASGNGGAISVGAGANVNIYSSSKSVSEFIGNSAAAYGGALDIETSDSDKESRVNNAIFKGNYANYGGAVEVYGKLKDGSTTKVFFNNCTFGGSEEGDANYATHTENEASGGAMFLEDNTYVNVGLSTFEGNHCDNKGGAICVKGWGMLQLYRDSFIGNYGYTGGAFYTEVLNGKYPDCYVDECSFDGNYITNSYGAVFNVNGVNDFAMYNSSVRGSYTTNNSSANKKNLAPSWVAIDVVQNTASISNCSIIGDVRRLKSDGVNFETLTSNTALVAVWGDKHYFTNNIILPESNDVASIGGGGSDKIDLNYNVYNKVIGVDATDNGGNTSGCTSIAIDDLEWSDEDNNSYYWKWNGTINGSAPSKPNSTGVVGRVQSYSPGFASWCGSDLYMDQLNVNRGDDGWWPGAYQGHVNTNNLYLTVSVYNILKSDADARGDYNSIADESVREALAQSIITTKSDIIAFNELDKTNLSGGANDLAQLCSSMTNYTWSLEYPNKVKRSGNYNYTYSTSYDYSEGFAYNNTKLELLESGYVWLSKESEVWYTEAREAYDKTGSPDRTCVWSKMKHIESGKMFWIFVAHLPTSSQGGQENMAKVVNKFAQSKVGSDPAILLGDMNSGPDTEAYGNLTDYWADGNINNWGTLSGSSANYDQWYSVTKFTTGRTDRRYDHIMTRNCTASSYKLTPVTYAAADGNDWCPSDHLPVTAKVTIL